MAQSLQLFQQNHGFFAEGPNRGPSQGADMAKTAQSTAEITCQRAHVGALAALGLRDRMIRVGNVYEFKPGDLDRPGQKLNLLAVAREIIGTLALDLDCRIARRDLLNEHSGFRQQWSDGFRGGPFSAGRNDASFSIVGVAFFAPPYGEAVELAAAHPERNSFVCFTKRNRQRTRSKRIERASMSAAFRAEQPFHDTYG